MQTQTSNHPFRVPSWIGFACFAAIALFYLWTEHQAHLLGALPYLLFLACPVLHLLMHRGHGHGDGSPPDGSSTGPHDHREER